MINPLFAKRSALSGGKSSHQASAASLDTSPRDCDEDESVVLPPLNIKYSARALRQPLVTSRPKLREGEQVGVYERGKLAVLAQVLRVNAEGNTVQVQLHGGEQKEVPTSSVVDPKLMKLINGLHHVEPPKPRTPRTPRSPKSPRTRSPSPRDTSPKPVRLPQLNTPRGPQADLMVDDWVQMTPDLDQVKKECIKKSLVFTSQMEALIGKPCKVVQLRPRDQTVQVKDGNTGKACWFPRKCLVKKGFSHGKRTSATTLHEVHFLLSRGDAPEGPPATVTAFRNALLKKFHSLESAWASIDTNGNGALDITEFIRACRHIQFAGNLKKIFSDLTAGGDEMRPELLDESLPGKLQSLPLQAGRGHPSPNQMRQLASPTSSDDGVRLSKPRPHIMSADSVSVVVPPVGNFNHGRRASLETLGEVSLIYSPRPEANGQQPGQPTIHDFKKSLLKKFESLENAWATIDTNGDGRLDYSEFIRACRHIQWVGNLKQWFGEFTGGEDTLRPELLDEDFQAKFRTWRSTQKSPSPSATIQGPAQGCGVCPPAHPWIPAPARTGTPTRRISFKKSPSPSDAM